MNRIVVIGGGPAGVWAAIEAKRKDAAAQVVLLTEEACEPYEKPPLSKAVLTGKSRPEDAPIAAPKGVGAAGVMLETGAVCTAIDRDRRELILQSGRRLPYDALVVATGSLLREIPSLPLGTPRVHYLRTQDHALALKKELQPGRRLVVVGGGLIGLEVAASAIEMAVHTTVIELAPRILARVCDEQTSAFVLDAHRRRGVDIRLGTAISKVDRLADGHLAIATGAGEIFEADVVVVGAGARADDRLAAAAGLATDDGIVVDAQCRTCDPLIFAAGDCTRFPGPHGSVRLENWRHAQDQGLVAGRNAAGGNEAYRTVPSYWSEQYDLYIQGVGWPATGQVERVRRTISDNSMLVFETSGEHLIHAVGINAQRDIATIRRLIERQVPVVAAELADPARPLAAMLKAKA
jgi:3-phenylpropionate/trans-cinnamate dioxygenase ferredoxin reductase subunit